MVVLNPGKRKRFMLHEGEIAEKAIELTLDKILGGDARFKAIKGQKLPDLVSDYEKTEDKKDATAAKADDTKEAGATKVDTPAKKEANADAGSAKKDESKTQEALKK